MMDQTGKQQLKMDRRGEGGQRTIQKVRKTNKSLFEGKAGTRNFEES